MDNASETLIEDVSQLHPNWRALASVNFKRKIFVKSSETITTTEIQKNETIEINESASEFYQEVIQMPSLSSSSEKTKSESIKKIPKRRKIEKEKIEFNKEILFRFATNDDSDGIKKHFSESKNPDINATDNFGWTALMMAACEGATNSFTSLLDLGADLNVSDRNGNNATSLAEKNKRQEILDIIESLNNAEELIEISDEEEEDSESLTFFCPDCKIQVSSKSHQTSTVHLINCKFMGNTDIKSFGISRTNRGYELMKTLGWDGNSALGSKKNGKLYPIKTVLRKGRSGLGIKQDQARITHFKAHDVRAIKFKPPPRAPTRKEIERNSLNEKRREQILRHELK